MGTVPIGTGEFLRIHSRVSWMFLPVERSITVSAPQRMAQMSFSTSSSIDDATPRVPAGMLRHAAAPGAAGSISGQLAPLVLADGDELHFGSDDPRPRVVHLR